MSIGQLVLGCDLGIFELTPSPRTADHVPCAGGLCS